LYGLTPIQKLSSSLVAVDEVTEVSVQLIMTVIVVSLQRGVLDDSVHSLHLAICPRVVGFSQSMLNVMLTANLVETMNPMGRLQAIAITR
jgi:hypothetical protein